MISSWQIYCRHRCSEVCLPTLDTCQVAPRVLTTVSRLQHWISHLLLKVVLETLQLQIKFLNLAGNLSKSAVSLQVLASLDCLSVRIIVNLSVRRGLDFLCSHAASVRLRRLKADIVVDSCVIAFLTKVGGGLYVSTWRGQLEVIYLRLLHRRAHSELLCANLLNLAYVAILIRCHSQRGVNRRALRAFKSTLEAASASRDLVALSLL
jgi:hypothetical protein